MEPVSVSRHNRKQVLKNLYGDLRNEKPKAPRFKIGDVVRINKQKLHFGKGYEQNWRRELFIVYEIVQRIPIAYRLKDLQGEEIKGTYYTKQNYKKVVESGFYPVENVIKQRKRRGITEYFVKFSGYPEKFNNWVTNIQKV
ncbi:chromo domain-containing protein [Trichonephila clavipes]|nr:chromo domain-containing protein [Trichonephila clavipes]